MAKFATTILGDSFDKINELGNLKRLKEIYAADRGASPHAYASSRDMIHQAMNRALTEDIRTAASAAVLALEKAEKEHRMVRLSLYKDTLDGDIYLLFATENRNIQQIANGYEMDVCFTMLLSKGNFF